MFILERIGAFFQGGFAWFMTILVTACNIMNLPFDFGGVHGAFKNLAYTFAYSTEKIQPDGILGTMRDMRVTMGKNEREGFQFVLRGRYEASLQYCFELSEVKNESGDTIPIHMFKEHYIYAGVNQLAGTYPDALVPYAPNQNRLEITTPHKNQGYYFELRTAADTPAGTYTGKIKIVQREEQDGYVWVTLATLVEAPFTVEVVDVTFPEAPYSDTAVGLGGGQFHALNGGGDYGALYQQYYDYLLDHKLSAYSLPYDILDPRADDYMSDPRVTSFQIPYPWGDDAALQAYYNKVQSNPIWARKGFFYPIDEPHHADQIQTYREITDRLTALCPGYHMVTPFYTWKFSEDGKDFDNFDIQKRRSDILCPISSIFAESGFPAALRKSVKDNGSRAWWYVCCGPTGDFCNMFIHLQGTRHRLLFWQQYQNSVTGLLYWHTTYWDKANPWYSSVTWNSFESCGDGSWLYPGRPVGVDGPVPSLRLKNIADGLEDYDLLCMAEAKLGRAYCEKKAAQLSASLTSYTLSPAKIESVRAGILRDLAKG